MIVGTPLRGVRPKHIGKCGHLRTGVPTGSNEHRIAKLEFTDISSGINAKVLEGMGVRIQNRQSEVVGTPGKEVRIAIWIGAVAKTVIKIVVSVFYRVK